MQGGSILAMSPSFNSYSSSRFAEIAVKVSREFREQRDELGIEEETDPILEERFKDLVLEKEREDRVEVEAAEEAEVVAEEKPEEREREEGEVIEEGEEEEEEEEEDENVEEEDDFEFAVVCRDSDTFGISADEIFSNGQIRPIYPVFDRSLIFNDDDAKPSEEEAQTVRLPLGKLLIEERDLPSSSSSEADELEGVAAGTYCVWTPKLPQATPDRCKKSNSTGSSKRWRFRDFLRSNSDGKDTFIFLNPSSAKAKKIEDNKTERSRDQKPAVPKIRRNSGEVKTVAGKLKAKGVAGDGASSVSAHEIHYVRNRALKEGDRRRSYLPYRQDLVGFFANVNGLSRNLHPF